MSSNKKSKKNNRIIQIIFIVIGLMTIVFEVLYLLNIIDIKTLFSTNSDNTSNYSQTMAYSGTNSNNSIKDNKSNKDTISIDKYVFVGDSRYVGMSAYEEDEDTFIAKNNMGYAYLEEQMELIKESCDKNTALIIGLGVNDLKYSRQKYIDTINEMAQDMDCHIFYMLVNPVDEKKEEQHGYSVENDVIDDFNSVMEEELSSDVGIIDTNSYLKEEGFETVDGLHYDRSTYKLIYDYIKECVNKAE